MSSPHGKVGREIATGDSLAPGTCPRCGGTPRPPMHQGPPPTGVRECLCPAPTSPERVDHPQHYGGKDNPYEAIKVMAAWTAKMTGIVAVDIGNALKYMSRAGKKVSPPLPALPERVAAHFPDIVERMKALEATHQRNAEIEDIKKAIWYLKHAMKSGGVPVWCAPLDAVQLGPEPTGVIYDTDVDDALLHGRTPPPRRRRPTSRSTCAACASPTTPTPASRRC